MEFEEEKENEGESVNNKNVFLYGIMCAIFLLLATMVAIYIFEATGTIVECKLCGRKVFCNMAHKVLSAYACNGCYEEWASILN